MDDRFDRLMTYDHVGRIKSGKSGAEARGGTVAQADMAAQLPYRQSYQFNAFGNLTERNNLHWGIENWYGQANNLSYSYQNNRVTNTGWQYDADGRATGSFDGQWAASTYDAKGQLVWLERGGEKQYERFYGGDNREWKRNEKTSDGNNWTEEIKYFIRSTVLGGETVSEVDATGRKLKTIVRAAGATIAWQTAYYYNNVQSEYVNFEHRDASGLSYRATTNNGIEIYGEGAEGSPAELDPLGGNVGLYSPYYEVEPPPPTPEYPTFQPLSYESPMYVNGQRVTCELDGLAIGCSQAYAALNNGSAIPASLAQYQHLPGFSFENQGLGIFTAYIPGHNFSTPGGGGGGTDDDPIRVGSYGYQPPQNLSFNFSNVSWSPTGRNQQDKIVPLGNVAKDAQKLISGNPNCADFIKRLLKGVAQQTGNPSVANPFAGNVVDFSRQTYKKRDGTIGEAAGKAYGRLFSLPDSNGRRESYGIVGISPKSEGFIYASIDYIQDYIHESIHNAGVFGTYSDRDLATASYNLIKSKDGMPISGLPKSALEEYEKLDEKDT